MQQSQQLLFRCIITAPITRTEKSGEKVTLLSVSISVFSTRNSEACNTNRRPNSYLGRSSMTLGKLGLRGMTRNGSIKLFKWLECLHYRSLISFNNQDVPAFPTNSLYFSIFHCRDIYLFHFLFQCWNDSSRKGKEAPIKPTALKPDTMLRSNFLLVRRHI